MRITQSVNILALFLGFAALRAEEEPVPQDKMKPRTRSEIQEETGALKWRRETLMQDMQEDLRNENREEMYSMEGMQTFKWQATADYLQQAEVFEHRARRGQEELRSIDGRLNQLDWELKELKPNEPEK